MTEHARQSDEGASATKLEDTQAFRALDRLVKDMEDGLDHPELWLLLKMAVEEGNAGDLLVILGALRPLQQPKVVKIFDVLEAFIQGIAGPRDEAIAKLRQIQAQDRLCPQVAGALSFLMHHGRPPEISAPIAPKMPTRPPSAGMNFPKPRGDSFDILDMACFKAALDSAEQYEKHFLTCPAFDNDLSLLSKALGLAQPNGLFLEFGVASGRTISHMARNTPHTHFYGFDSFEGLPEAWRSGFDKGVFAQARLPIVPPNVTLIKGWFDDTLPAFLHDQPHMPLSLLHVDCDLYSSTKTIFANLKDRIVPGTLIVFDEYWNYPGWRKHEFKAFEELLAETGIQAEPFGFVPSHQQVGFVISGRG
ncbi:class I SAM-dependent methyltransferase [Bradyrhizobium macuxiense]|uniref:class I SAM-dependent methyltransferase n=1 Tax=Bradyrhizobium macuxiense TaxID=1755647 RepID=UPI00136632D3|nr:class I SAM-dependent methyltransferase [Bradyrhizobium macuxiense]